MKNRYVFEEESLIHASCGGDCDDYDHDLPLLSCNVNHDDDNFPHWCANHGGDCDDYDDDLPLLSRNVNHDDDNFPHWFSCHDSY